MSNWYEDNKEKGWNLAGDHFIADISFSEIDAAGLIRTNVDPRKLPKKPDAYAGTVTEVSESCSLVKVGDRVVFERWDWNQGDVDEKRIIARERELIVVNEEPVAGYIIFKIKEEKLKSSLILHNVEKPRPKFWDGEVLASAVKDVNVGQHYIFEAVEYYQYHYGDGRMAFRINKGANLLLHYEPKVGENVAKDEKNVSNIQPVASPQAETATGR